ncbi:hypothetical protein AVEN_70581-1 [Araneus ventricosus]|uniref:Uncharacterized protein n=1 Tax=Araneus ventricosus TaxID=182803 RepID=A0A4Y2CHA9_ARAVE|nr:hypothetical protein AVEN_70581-1 [Araneus ventricosus]
MNGSGRTPSPEVCFCKQNMASRLEWRFTVLQEQAQSIFMNEDISRPVPVRRMYPWLHDGFAIDEDFHLPDTFVNANHRTKLFVSNHQVFSVGVVVLTQNAYLCHLAITEARVGCR